MRFLVDAQLPPLLCAWLADRGHVAEHVSALALAGAEDPLIWSRAVADGAVLLTKDEDFIAIRQRAERGHAVCWLRIGNATNPELLAWFEAVYPAMMDALESGETIVEVR